MNGLIVVISFFISLSFVFGCAASLMYHGKDGWGWLLFVAVIIYGSIDINIDDSKRDEKHEDTSTNQSTKQL